MWNELGASRKKTFWKIAGGMVLMLGVLLTFLILIVSDQEADAAQTSGLTTVTLYTNDGRVIRTWEAQKRLIFSDDGFLVFRDKTGYWHRVSGIVGY